MIEYADEVRAGVPELLARLRREGVTRALLLSGDHTANARAPRVLSGTVTAVEQVLNALGVGRRRNETTGDIEHGGTVMLVNSRGRVEWRIDGGWDRVGQLLQQVR